jgi:hypothetical protein
MKLGRQPAKFDASVPMLASINLKVTKLPSVSDKWKAISYWPMLRNDIIGNCTIAGAGHVIEYWKIVAGLSLITMTDLEAQVQYEILGGYDPKQTKANGSNPTDQGCIELNVLQYFQTHGIMAGSKLHPLIKFVNVPTINLDQIKSSIINLGNCYLGYNLPTNAIQTTLWDIDPTATIEGGHCVNAVGFDDSLNLLYVVSWGTIVPVTYNFHNKYCEEAWSLYNQAWIDAQ